MCSKPIQDQPAKRYDQDERPGKTSPKNEKLPHDLLTTQAIPGVYDFLLSDEYNQSYIKKMFWLLQAL